MPFNAVLFCWKPDQNIVNVMICINENTAKNVQGYSSVLIKFYDDFMEGEIKMFLCIFITGNYIQYF